MPNQGLSETGQIIAAIATAIILALLAKFGLTPNEESPQDDGGKGKGNIVINFNANGVAEREASRGKSDMRPDNLTDESNIDLSDSPPYRSPVLSSPSRSPIQPIPPDVTTPKPMWLKTWGDLQVGSLPIQNRKSAIMQGLGASGCFGDGAICVAIVLDRRYSKDTKISVWAQGIGFDVKMPYDDVWRKVDVARIVKSGTDEFPESHWVATIPTTANRFTVLCRTDDSSQFVDDRDAHQYCEFIRNSEVGGTRYMVTKEDALNTFGDDGLLRKGTMRLSDKNEDKALLAIYIPYRKELHKTPEK